MLLRTDLGDEVHRYQKSLVMLFKGKRRVLSTSPYNGGYQEGLTAVFNHDCNPGAGMAAKIKAPTYAEHMEMIAAELGLEPATTAGISTAASMDNVSIISERHDKLSVTALVTGGVEVNGGRVGDPASYEELKEKHDDKELSGTINIIMTVNVDLTPGALTRALVTCTEAKTAALQELMAPSRYSSGLATGSGTDGTILVCNADSPYQLTYAGKHSKLGELIGKAVKATVKEALYKQTGLSPQRQCSVIERIERYGITPESLWKKYVLLAQEAKISKPAFIHNLELLDKHPLLVSYTSLYVHLLDQYAWGLLEEEEIAATALSILQEIKKIAQVKTLETNFTDHDPATFQTRLLDNFAAVLLAAVKQTDDSANSVDGGAEIV